MKHFRFSVKLSGVVGVIPEGFGTTGQSFKMLLRRGLCLDEASHGWSGGVVCVCVVSHCCISFT